VRRGVSGRCLIDLTLVLWAAHDDDEQPSNISAIFT
jgi:hypothetical protein